MLRCRLKKDDQLVILRGRKIKAIDPSLHGSLSLTAKVEGATPRHAKEAAEKEDQRDGRLVAAGVAAVARGRTGRLVLRRTLSACAKARLRSADDRSATSNLHRQLIVQSAGRLWLHHCRRRRTPLVGWPGRGDGRFFAA